MSALPQFQQQLPDLRLAAPASEALTWIDSLVAVGVFMACLALFGVPLARSHLILVLLVFSLTYPGTSPIKTSAVTLARGVLTGWSVTVALLLFFGWATRTLELFDRRVVAAWLLLTPLVQFGAHLAVPQLLRRRLAAAGAQRVAAIAGAGELGWALAERISANPLLGVRVAGFFDDRSAARSTVVPPERILGRLEQLPAYAKAHRVDLIYITLPMASQQRILQLLNELQDTTASIYFAPDIFLCDLIQARISTIGGMPVVSVCETPFCGFNALVKRISDVVLSLAICALILPLLLAIAIGVKMSSPGPIIFRQRRYGLDGREIYVYKFRSMTVTEDGPVIRQATSADSRVTPFGALLRRYSLDELPQFINVLQGRMSIVGPRPHAVAHTELYRKLIRGYMIRHKVRPGITGWAQVNGLRGETDTLDKMEARIAHDLAYLQRWSLQLDLWIILKTILAVWRQPAAY